MSAANSSENPDQQPATGLRTPPVCALRSFAVYELPGSIELHCTADHGQTIAWAMSPRMAAALGAKLKLHARVATERPLHPAGGSL